MAYPFIEELYQGKPDLFFPYIDDSWIDYWVHTWSDDFDTAVGGDSKANCFNDHEPLISINTNIEKGAQYPQIPEWLIDSGRGVKYWPNTPDLNCPDAYGFYLPFHVSRDMHGIYLLEDRCLEGAKVIEYLDKQRLLVGHYERILKVFVYYHEAFHHKVEMFATSLELIARQKCYLGAVSDIYQENRDKVSWLEEIYANVHAYFKTLFYMKSELPGANQRKQLAHVLTAFISSMNPGYREAAHLLKKGLSEEQFRTLKAEFWEEIQSRYLPNTPSFSPTSWLFSNFDYPYNKINGRINFLLPPNSPLLERMKLDARFMSTHQFITRCKRLGDVQLVREGKGSHKIWIGPSNNKVSIPNHRELKVGTMAQLLKDLGLGISVHEFLRG